MEKSFLIENHHSMVVYDFYT